MLSLTLKNVPRLLHQRLKQTALAHHRSMNQEALVCLEMALSPGMDKENLLNEIRATRSGFGKKVYVTDQMISKLKESGRS